MPRQIKELPITAAAAFAGMTHCLGDQWSSSSISIPRIPQWRSRPRSGRHRWYRWVTGLDLITTAYCSSATRGRAILLAPVQHGSWSGFGPKKDPMWSCARPYQSMLGFGNSERPFGQLLTGRTGEHWPKEEITQVSTAHCLARELCMHGVSSLVYGEQLLCSLTVRLMTLLFCAAFTIVSHQAENSTPSKWRYHL